MTDVVEFCIYAPPTRTGAVLRAMISDVLAEFRMHVSNRDIEITREPYAFVADWTKPSKQPGLGSRAIEFWHGRVAVSMLPPDASADPEELDDPLSDLLEAMYALSRRGNLLSEIWRWTNDRGRTVH